MTQFTATSSIKEVERADELNLLARLLDERHRPVPPPPTLVPHAQRQLRELMRLLAATFEEVA